jgi:hypothetical protein
LHSLKAKLTYNSYARATPLPYFIDASEEKKTNFGIKHQREHQRCIAACEQ